MRRNQWWSTTLATAVLAATAEWIRSPHLAWPLLVAGLTVLAGFAGWKFGVRFQAVAGGGAVLALLLGLGQWRLDRVDRNWPADRDRRIEAVRRQLGQELAEGRRRIDRLAAEALSSAGLDRRAAMDRLRRLLPTDGPETAVAVLEPTGVPWAWAGRHRLAPQVEGDSLDARVTDFYATFEARRTGPNGRRVIATTLIWADSATPRPDRSLTDALGKATGVQLRVLAPGQSSSLGEILDYTEPTSAGDRLLFSVQVIPPDQRVAHAAVLKQAVEWAALSFLAVWLLALLGAPHAPGRLLLLGLLLWSTVRAPLGDALGLGDLFSPATFFRGFLGPLSHSAGHLLLAGAVVTVLAAWLSRRRGAHRRWMMAPAALLLLGAPYLVSALGQGITPPVDGVSTGLWITWQLTLTVATAAVILSAGALFPRTSLASPSSVWLGVAVAAAAAVVGLVVWVPKVGWPDWYPLLWIPALFLVARPAPRWASLTGTAMVAGTAAALVTWGAELNARVRAAQDDLRRLGHTEDPLAEPLLERFGDQVLAAQPIRGPAQMYVLWRSSYLAELDYPVRLELWTPQGGRRAMLDLDSLDLPAPLMAALVQGLDPTRTRALVPLLRVPGVHTILLQRLEDGSVLTAAVGPRTRLLGPTRLARLVRPPPEGAPLYEIRLAPPLAGARGITAGPSPWWREGWVVHADWVLDLPGGLRHVHVDVPLREASALVIRGTLLVTLDLLVLSLLWFISDFRRSTLQRISLRRTARSFQARLVAVLGLFFVIPAAGFTAWSLSQLDNEAAGRRDLLIAQALRDAVLTAGGLLQGTDEYVSEGLAELSSRLETEFVLYSGGRLVASSAPILEQLALVEPLLDRGVFQRLVLEDELEVLRNGTTYVAPVRVGYRVVQAGPPGGVGILATPQVADEGSRGRDQRDLAFGLLFAALMGGVAALTVARFVARFLSRPVADLHRSAVAVGQSQPLPAHGPPPVEFEAVFGAFDRMAMDIRTSQVALERARQRTAAVLANVATAVVALDPAGRIVLANDSARALLGSPLPDGADFTRCLGPDWRLPGLAVERLLQGGEPEAVLDFEVERRRVRLQMARIKDEPGRGGGGVVLALDDLTDATRAARVLAWGEMARQVAHEIKNPLTPIRLGMQHLERVRRDHPETFPRAFEQTAGRIVSEIDRLDTIARAFSRFGLPSSELSALEPVELGPAAREVAVLYQLARDGTEVEVSGGDAVRRPARRDEVKEVLGNLVENARNAGARRIRITISEEGLVVEDDGKGIAPEVLARIFEPTFSTTTSGAGLGLPIVKRLVEGWGARISVESELGRGTRARIRW